MRLQAKGVLPVKSRDPFLSSLIGYTSLQRLLGVIGILILLWLAIAWAVALP
jgi:hypothetical protein